MGYHFAIDSVAFPTLAAPGDTANFTLSLDNVGVAPIYKHLPLKFRLHSDAYTYTADTGADITAFLPGKAVVPFSCTLPADIPTGSYSLDVSIGVESDPMICFCTDAPRTGRWYSVGTVQIRG